MASLVRLTSLLMKPAHSAALARGTTAPVAFLPFIKLIEDPYQDVLGQTLKLADSYSFIFVRSGTGKEYQTAAHEHLHAAVRGLPGAFEEGFCRHSLERAGVESGELESFFAHDDQTVRLNLASIGYPHLLVLALSQAFGDKEIESAFFTGDTAPLDEKVKRAAGSSLVELDAHFRDGSLHGAASALAGLRSALGQALSAKVIGFIERLEGIVAGNDNALR